MTKEVWISYSVRRFHTATWDAKPSNTHAECEILNEPTKTRSLYFDVRLQQYNIMRETKGGGTFVTVSDRIKREFFL